MKRVLMMMTAMLVGLTQAQAGGFEQPNQSASAAGVANAFVATANDASALIYNPAGIAWQSGVSVMGSGRLDYRDSSVITPLRNAPNNGKEPFTGSIYASWAPLDSNFAAGFGFSPLYIANNDWATAFPAGSANPGGITKLTVDHSTFDFVYALSSDLAIGGGADWYITRATLSQGAATFKANDFASFGGHASVMWKPLPAWSVGAMFRSGARVSMSGQGNSGSLSFKLPDDVNVGIAHDFSDVWHLEVDAKWTRWSMLKDMNVVRGGVITQPNAMNLRDTVTVMTGLTWTWRENSQFRLGYAYDQGANRSLNFNPVIADQDSHRISIGGGGDVANMHMDLAYQYILYSDKTATGAHAGLYRDRRQSVMFSVSKVFE